MSTLVISYTVNPIWSGLKRIGKSFYAFMEMAQYARAASELARLGYHKEAKNAMMQYKNIKQERKNA